MKNDKEKNIMKGFIAETISIPPYKATYIKQRHSERLKMKGTRKINSGHKSNQA